MGSQKGLILWSLAVGLFVLAFAAIVQAQEDSMVLHYADGTSQKIKLDKPVDTLRNIEFVEPSSLIKVIAGTYGGNCGAPSGNVTSLLASACDGKVRCEYVVQTSVLGDPAKGCAKDYDAQWRCGNSAQIGSVNASAEAGFGKTVVLGCPVR